MNSNTVRTFLEELKVEEEVIQILIEEDVTIQDLETLKKVDLDALIKKYGQRRRFARVLIQWMLKRGLPVDPELLVAFGEVQPAQVICEQKNQSSLVESSDEISLSTSSDQLSSTSFITDDSNITFLTTDLTFPLLTSQENNTEKLPFSLEINVEDCSDEHTALEEDLENVSKLDDKILYFIDKPKAPLKEKNVQQLQVQSVISQEKKETEDSQSKNPLFFLLQKNGLRCRELVSHSQRNNFVLEWRDINLIARITAKHLLNLAIPPKRKILSSTLTRGMEL
nr:PREDICTED: uncharacterized protein LOC105670120 [Linepithema humile]